ncbi:MAG TPA: zinc ribbon domain-containing protein [Thermomicrobiales bacterium]|nr:zinc ribbon domain-containing protein [Thermomicrobiales bacterium]
MSTGSSSITCPECGTLNRAESVFCAECGAMLPHTNAATNATASFTPIDSLDDELRETSDSETTQIFTPRTDYDDYQPETDSSWSSSGPGPSAYVPEPGRRGFVLGIIATILILIVFGFFLWSTVASDGFRDSITGLF